MLRWILARFWPALRTSVLRWSSDHGSLHSAALAYYAAFSFLPLCLTLVAVLGLATQLSGQARDRQQQMLALVRDRAGPWLTDQLQVILLGVRDQALLGGPLGVLTLAAAGLAIFVQLEAMFDDVWKGPDDREDGWLTALWTVVYQRIIAFLMLLGVGADDSAVRSQHDSIGRHVVCCGTPRRPHGMARHAPAVGHRRQRPLVGHRFQGGSRAPVRWRDAFCGGLFAALIWQIGQHILAYFVISDRYGVYGVVGSFIAVMVWFYYAGAVFFLGAELVRALGAETHNRRSIA